MLFLVEIINNFRGDLTDTSATTATLERSTLTKLSGTKFVQYTVYMIPCVLKLWMKLSMLLRKLLWCTQLASQ